MNRLYSPLFLSFLALWSIAIALPVSAKNKKEKTPPVKTPTAYEKLFKDKTVTTARGLFTLHLVEDKIYLEIPSGLLGKPLLMGTTVEKVSDPQESSVGFHPTPPLRIEFAKLDSLICIRKPTLLNQTAEDPAISQALRKSQTEAILEVFPVKAYAPDSAMVIDATSFLFRDEPALNPIDPKGYNHMDGWVKRTATFQKANSLVTGVEAFEDNASITCCMSYLEKMALLGVFSILENKPFSAFVKRTFLLLPEDNAYRPRFADARVGTSCSAFTLYSGTRQGSREEYYANRWQLSPQKPVIFYVDTLLPDSWQKSVAAAIGEWNKAFARIGYPQALQAKPYPANDTAFDAHNIKYSCIRYIPSPATTITDHLWTDPATGEILNANIYIPHNLPAAIQRNCFLQTAAYNEKARSLLPDPETVSPMLTCMLLRHIGHCLGLTDNMAGSAAYPPDSLRSAAFVSRHGYSASVMDELPFNYLLSSGQHTPGAPLAQQQLGAYDYWAIQWLYAPIPEAETPRQELPVLRQQASARNHNPLLLYSRPQSKKAYYDPRGMSQDLGNDPVKAAGYGFQQLAEVVRQAPVWLDPEDTDYSQRADLYSYIINQANEYVIHVLQQVGGIYLNDRYAGDPLPAYQPVAKERQRQSLRWMLNEIEQMGWLDNDTLLQQGTLTGSAADFAQKFFCNLILIQLNAMTLSESKSENPYTQAEATQDILTFLLQETRTGQTPSPLKRHLQGLFTDYLISASEILPPKASKASKNSPDSFYSLHSKSGMTALQSIAYASQPDRAHFWYGQLLALKDNLQKAIPKAPTRELKDEYAYRIFVINKALKGK